MPLLTKIYVWSIIFEPLLFFVVAERTVTGVGGNIFRVLQFIVIFCLVVNFLVNFLRTSRFLLVNFLNPFYINYFYYSILLFLSSLVGILSGSYDLASPYQLAIEESHLSRFLNSAEVRPFFEYFIVLYYFYYFSILPSRLLVRDVYLDYFFSRFKFIYFVSFIVGVVDIAFDYFEIHLIPRHISDWVHVGLRFHGLAGEPRDAFVYLFLGLAMLHLDAFIKGRELSKFWIAAIIIAAILTESASGFLGIAAFTILYVVYSIGRASIRELLLAAIVCLVIFFTLYIVSLNSERIVIYLKGAADVWYVIESGKDLPYGMNEQRDNIYPLYDFTVKLLGLDFWAVFLGSGVGSASVVNNVYYSLGSAMANPHSQFVRVIYESGALGAFFFLLSFVYPVKILTTSFPLKKRSEFITLTLLLFGCFMAHRSLASFIYLGIFMATFRVLGSRFDVNVVRFSIK